MIEFVAQGNEEKRALMEAIFEDPYIESSSNGTKCHTVFENCMIGGVTSETEIIEMMVAEGVTDDMLNDEFFRTHFVKEIQELAKSLKKALWFAVEVRVKLYGTGTYGTVDLVFQIGDNLYVYDLKTGRLEVVAKSNVQLVAYSVGVLDVLGYDRYENIECGIVAVRFKSSRWGTTAEYVESFKNDVLIPALLGAHDLNPIATTGKWCMNCRAKLFCKEWLTEMKRSFDDDVFSTDRFENQTNKQLTDNYFVAKQIEKYIKAAKKEFVQRRESFDGMDDDRIQFVAPKPVIAYRDKKKALKTLQKALGKDIEKVVKTELLAPKDIEKLVDEKTLKELTKTTTRKPFIKMR